MAPDRPAPFLLRTRGAAALEDSSGAAVQVESRALALTAFILAGGGHRPEAEVLLHLWPDLSLTAGRAALDALLGSVAKAAGAELLVRREGIVSAAPAAITADGPPAGEHYLLGLVLPDSPEFDEWLAARRAETGVVGPGRPARGRSLVMVAAIVVAGFLVALLRPDRQVQGFGEGDVVLLADVVNATTDTLLDRTLQEAALVALQQSRQLQLLPRARVAAVLSHMGLSPDEWLGEVVAREVAIRTGVRWVLELRVAPGPDGEVILSAALVEAESGLVRHRAEATAAGADEVVAAVDRIIRGTRRAVGESRREVASGSRPLELVTTPSLAALRAYSDGAAAWRRNEFRMAGEYWDRAVSIDTGFAMAFAALGAYHYYLLNREAGREHFAAAVARRDRLTERERLRIEENWAAFRGDTDSALALALVLAERYPSVLTQGNLGTRYLRLERWAEAIPALEQVLRWDPMEVNAHINLATAYKGQRDFVRAVQHYQEAGQLDQSILYQHNINGEFGAALVLAGRAGDAESAFHQMTRVPTTANPSNGHRSLGYLALWEGRMADAAREFGIAADMNRQGRAWLSEWRNRLLRAAALRVGGKADASERELDKAERILEREPVNPTFAALAGDALVEAGRLRAAARLLGRVRAVLDPASDVERGAERYLTGVVALARAASDSALGALAAATALPLPVHRTARRAEAEYLTGRRGQAITLLQEVAARPEFGSEAELEFLNARLKLAGWLEAESDTASAVRLYRDAARQWQNGDQDLPALIFVRSRLMALGARWDR